MLFPALPVLDFGVEGALAAETAGPQLLRDQFGLDKGLLAKRQLLYFSALSLAEELVHVVVGLVPEGLEGQELLGVLYIAVLLEGSPAGEVVVFEHEVLGTIGLLSRGGVTSLMKFWALVCALSMAWSLKSRCGGVYLSV